ncbi:hypothetical protein [Methanolapillus africanus]|uniref:hypothetical protein n=1 Tax=Methanolapillus africanus TaxID=3028297 RepID=UPI0030B8AE0B
MDNIVWRMSAYNLINQTVIKNYRRCQIFLSSKKRETKTKEKMKSGFLWHAAKNHRRNARAARPSRKEQKRIKNKKKRKWDPFPFLSTDS